MSSPPPAPRRRIRVLLVEDNPGDVGLIREGLGAGPLDVDLHDVPDGETGLQYLRREGPYGDALAPDMILLDLDLPRRDGREILREIKTDPALREIPVCVLTSSTDPLDVRLAYQSHANSYVAKPLRLEAFLDAVRSIEQFWFSVAALPRTTE